MPILFARTLLPLVQLPPGGHWSDTTPRLALRARPAPASRPRGRRRARPHPLPGGVRPGEPARRRAWSGVAQRDFTWERVPTVSYRDENGVELLDLPGRAAPTRGHPAAAAISGQLGSAAARLRGPRPHHPAGGPAAEADLERRLHRHLRRPGRGELDDGRADAAITPHIDFPRAAVEEEALRTARFCAPEADRAHDRWLMKVL